MDLGERPSVSRHVLENLGMNDQIESVVVERQLAKILLVDLTSVEVDDGAGRSAGREVLAACQIGGLSGKGLVEGRELLRDIDGFEAVVTPSDWRNSRVRASQRSPLRDQALEADRSWYRDAHVLVLSHP